ncbi:MAG: type II secretion system protein GspM [Usitatibacter sp.]
MNAVDLWRSRSPRERSLVGAGLVVLAVMLVVSLVWLPLERTRVRLAGMLPELRASVLALERDAQEVKRVRALPPTIPANPAPLVSVIGANAWGRELPGVQITIPDEKHVRLAAPDVPFDALLDWLTNAQAAHGLQVESARIEALPAPGRVSADLTLERS